MESFVSKFPTTHSTCMMWQDISLVAGRQIFMFKVTSTETQIQDDISGSLSSADIHHHNQHIQILCPSNINLVRLTHYKTNFHCTENYPNPFAAYAENFCFPLMSAWNLWNMYESEMLPLLVWWCLYNWGEGTHAWVLMTEKKKTHSRLLHENRRFRIHGW